MAEPRKADVVEIAEARARPSRSRRRNRPTSSFDERLRALENDVEQALAAAGGALVHDRSVAEAVESLLDGYARLARAVGGSRPVGTLAALFGGSRTVEVDPFGYDRAYEESVAPLFRALYRTWWRVETAGIENVPADGKVLLIANHAGGLFAYDGAMLKVALLDEHPTHRAARPLVDDFVYRLPFIGDFMTRCGGVRASMQNAERLLRQEQAVAVFPEGTKGIGKSFEQRYQLARFGRGGFVRLALRTGSPVVPVAIVGAEEIHPILARWEWLARQIGLPYFPITPTFPWLGLLGLVPLPRKWRIEFGTPFDWSSHGPDAADDRILVSRLTEEVRTRVQHMLVGALDRRGPAFF
jgi:1-acyl-sn-glycerol-3-phosphate acyltransferase